MNHILDELMKDSYDFLKSVADKAKTIAASSENSETHDILSYPLLSKGHMFRPFLVYLTYLAASEKKTEGVIDRLVTFGAALELIHNASLIHDDLIDQEDIRRGKPSLYKKYGTNNAVLAGNCYYIRALQLSNDELGPQITQEILTTAFSMCTGELLQAQYENLLIPDTVYFDIIRAKTAGLAALSCKGAAMILGSSNAEIWGMIGEKIGLIYQLKDDAKDKDANLRHDFNVEDCIQLLTKETEELLEQAGCTDQNRRFTDLIRLF